MTPLPSPKLRLIVAMQVGKAELDWIRQRIAARVESGTSSRELHLAIAALADDSAVEQLHRLALNAEQDWLIFNRFGWLCDRALGDRAWQDRIWDVVLSLADTRKNGWAELLFSGVIAQCHTPKVVESLSERLANIVALGQMQVTRLGHRFEEIASPAQIEGVGHSDSSAAHHLQRYAVISTGPTNRSMTMEAYAKEHAWLIAMFLGYAGVIDWVASAVDQEQNKYQQHKLMDAVAILSLPSLPTRATRLLGDVNLSFERGSDDPEVLAFLGAARLAASRLSPDSLRLLLGASGLIDGHPFRSPVEDSVELARWLIDNGHPEILEDLTEALLSNRPMACSMATRTFQGLAADTRTKIPEKAISALEALALDEQRPPYLRGDAISTIGVASRVSESFLDALAHLCHHDNEELRARAASTIVICGLLGKYRSDVEACAFWQSEKQYTPAPSNKLTTYEAHLIGTLAAIEPERYAQSAGTVIRSAFALAASEAIRGISAAKENGTVPGDVIGAIVSRIYGRESFESAGMFLFQALADLDPARLLSERWEMVWNDWMPQSREALASVLARAAATSFGEELRNRAMEVAKLLIRDGTFAVRRSGARALAELDEGTLKSQCEEYATAGSILLRERAAEAAAWISIDADDTLDNAILRELATDAERRVRRAANRSREEARRRRWAAEHLRSVGAASQDPNLWVLNKYASGAALIQVGDDRAMEMLTSTAQREDLPPNVRHWYRSLLKDLDRKWRDTTKKWPEPWLPWKGSIERLQGSLTLGQETYDAHFTLWLQPGDDDDQRPAWGGTAWSESKSLWLHFFRGSGADQVRLKVEHRIEAYAIVVNATDSQLTLIGSGPYPAPTE